jgi:hypothetical protein
MPNLSEAVERSQEMIREAISDARSELEQLRTRQTELENQIAEAEALLGKHALAVAVQTTMTLHEALVQVLREGGNEGKTARELADAVNGQGLYRKRDGSPVEPNQIQARVNNYGTLFRKSGSLISLHEDSPTVTAAAATFAIFRDDDDAFFEWLAEHPDGYFLNTERNPKPGYLVLHRPDCPHFTGGSSLHWTKDYIKVCSADRAELEAWALDSVGGEVTLCRSCFG